MGGAPPSAIRLKALSLSFSLSLNVCVFSNVLLKGVSVVPVVSWVFMVTWVKRFSLIMFQFRKPLSAAGSIVSSSLFCGVDARGSYVLIVCSFCCEFMIRGSAFLPGVNKDNGKSRLMNSVQVNN